MHKIENFYYKMFGRTEIQILKNGKIGKNKKNRESNKEKSEFSECRNFGKEISKIEKLNGQTRNQLNRWINIY